MRQLSIKTIAFLGLSGLIASQLQAQDTYLGPEMPETRLISRIEARVRHLMADGTDASMPVSRRELVNFLSDYEREARVGSIPLSRVDEFNINRAIALSGEWFENSAGESGFVSSRRPILKYFYQKQTDLINVETGDFFLSVNPVLYFQANYEMDRGSFTRNIRGAEVRARIADRIGLYTMLADNQEKLAGYMRPWVDAHRKQLPEQHLAVLTGENFDIFMARGYVDVGIIKKKLNLSFGYDKHHVGYGMRSLVYGYNAAPTTFMRLRAKWRNFQYESLITEQMPNYEGRADVLFPRRYAAVHQLNYTPKRWLSVGIFESTMLSQSKKTAITAFVPVIGWQSIARQAGNTEANNAWGLQFKAIPTRDVQVYGQAFFDKLDLGSIGQGSWENRYAFQLGLKYFDVLSVANLDGQLEWNLVRPFTYLADNDSSTSFTHYNQPLAHPLGNNFSEIIGNLRYQPSPLWTIEGRAVYAVRGVPEAGKNYGTSIYQLATDRTEGDKAYPFLVGEKKASLWGNLNVAYELRPNLFLEVGGTLVPDADKLPNSGNVIGYGAIRWNIGRTLYDYRY